MSRHGDDHPLVAAIWAFHDKHERWDALADVHERLDDATFYDLFVGVWSNSETNHLNLGTIDALIAARGVTGERVMPHLRKADRTFYGKQPERITVYRGATEEEPFTDYSWSTSKRQAIWFGNRCSNGTPMLLTGLVAKADILFAYNGRGESEIAAQTHHVGVIERRRLGPYKVDNHFDVFAAAQSGQLFPPEATVMLRVQHETRLLGRPLAEVKAIFYDHTKRLRDLGFVTKADRDLDMLDGIDWGQLERQECAA